MNSVQGATFLVTGGAGLVGSYIVDHLLAGGAARVRVLDNFLRGREENLAQAAATGRLELHRGDVCDAALVDRLTSGCDGVFHQAAMRITLCVERPRECLDSMVMGTLNVIESCLRHKVRRLIAASSVSVYGLAEEFPTRETHHLYANRTLYGAAKVANEQMYRAFAEMNDLRYVAFRYFNVYGPRMDRTGAYTEVMVRWLYAAMDGQRPKIFGRGEQSMDFVHVDDIARANLAAWESDVTDEVFNVCTGRESTLLELWRIIQEVADAKGIEPEYQPPRTVGPVGRRVGDPAKARDLLGFETRVSLEEGMRSLYEWLKSAPRMEVPR
ncbi:MAG: NAD-dependent epimerase/dehydratase family protein [Verrucomicrobiae bacterium]|nr:NAD-dependent epimerase/dehydratase family protein [Verrucomicrobiae bacterium]